MNHQLPHPDDQEDEKIRGMSPDEVREKLEEEGVDPTDIKIFGAMLSSKALELLEMNDELPEDEDSKDE